MWKKLGFFTIFSFLLLSPLALFAIEKNAGEVVFVAKDQTINQNYYAAGKTIEIYGTINGDLFLAGNNVVIDSENINGDIFVAAESISIKNKINGNVRVVGKQIEISGLVTGNAFIVGDNLLLTETAELAKHLTFWGSSASLHGQVGQHLEGGMEQLLLTGSIGQGVDVYLSPRQETNFQIADTAQISGGINYQALTEASISENAQVDGQVNFQKWTEPEHGKTFSQVLWSLIIKFFGMLIVGMILVYFWPKFFTENFSSLKGKLWQTPLFGLLFLFLTPLLAFALMITVIGIPIALIMLTLWAIGLYLAKILGAWLIAKFIKNKWLTKYNWSQLSILAFGLAIYLILGKVPVVGWIIILVAYLMAWGLFWQKLKIKK
ncbi:hypothetical protein H6761_04145 [Candidatus Nomurabacteria bacterium]|nr:hypothetical protein [Candidatus Nomurabacteria bacterium]